MNLSSENSKPQIKRVVVGVRYPLDRVALLDAVKARWGVTDRGAVIEAALNRLLVAEGLLDEAA
jgi:hypothetical protein